MIKRIMTMFAIGLLTLGLGCKSKKDGEAKNKDQKAESQASAKQGEDKAQDKKAKKKAQDEKAEAGPKPLKDLGIKADVPSGAKVNEAPVGDGVMVQGSGLVVTVKKLEEPKRLEAVKKEAKDMYSGKKVNVEQLDDGWALTFVNEGGAGKNYWVNTQRKIGGTNYYCTTTSSSKKQQDNALKFCKSLSG